tara:strand:- start:214 stop:726 length:513 start_codon:yes stop_codon:yes gene_type:complete
MIYPPNIIIDFKVNTVNKDFTLKWSGHDHGIKEFEKEKQCLILLEKNFINEPKINHFPFPKIIECKHLNITMTYCGESLKVIEKKQRKNKIETRQWLADVFDYNKLYNTIECIINNLVKNNIRHKDINKKNLCIDKNYNIHLIDFEFSKLQDHDWDPEVEKIKMLSWFNL